MRDAKLISKVTSHRKREVEQSPGFYLPICCRVAAVALFRTDFLVFCYSNLEQAKRWWIEAFDCKAVKVPPDWDNQLPLDVALQLPGDSEPTILLSDRAETTKAGFDRSLTAVPVVFSDKLKKAHEHFSRRGVAVGAIQGDEAPHFFEIRDIEGNIVEICEET